MLPSAVRKALGRDLPHGSVQTKTDKQSSGWSEPWAPAAVGSPCHSDCNQSATAWDGSVVDGGSSWSHMCAPHGVGGENSSEMSEPWEDTSSQSNQHQSRRDHVKFMLNETGEV